MSEPVHFEAAAALADSWSDNWLWGLPIIVLSVLVHCFGLFNVHERIVLPLSDAMRGKSAQLAFACLIGAMVLAIAALHALEAEVWAFAYVALDALPDWRSAMLYSLSAMTSYGHADLYLEKHWQMMGALEALNGMMLFGLTTAGLFSVLQNYAPWVRVVAQRAEGARWSQMCVVLEMRIIVSAGVPRRRDSVRLSGLGFDPSGLRISAEVIITRARKTRESRESDNGRQVIGPGSQGQGLRQETRRSNGTSVAKRPRLEGDLQ